MKNILILKEARSLHKKLDKLSGEERRKAFNNLSREDRYRYLAHREGREASKLLAQGNVVDAGSSAIDGSKYKRSATSGQGRLLNAIIMSESYSDYELYQFLEANGYTTTEANLEILKEGLKTGKYYID